MLYMCAVGIVADKNDGIMKLKYEKLIKNGKPKKVALVAVSAHIFRGIVSKLNYYKNLNK